MRTLLITSTVRAPEQDYPGLIEAIKRYPTWCRLMPATWQVGAYDTPTKVCDTLLRSIATNDQLYVVDVTGQGWAACNLPGNVADWMQKAPDVPQGGPRSPVYGYQRPGPPRFHRGNACVLGCMLRSRPVGQVDLDC